MFPIDLAKYFSTNSDHKKLQPACQQFSPPESVLEMDSSKPSKFKQLEKACIYAKYIVENLVKIKFLKIKLLSFKDKNQNLRELVRFR